MWSYVLPACDGYPSVRPLVSFALLVLVGSACASPGALGAEHSVQPSEVALDSMTNADSPFVLVVATVRTAELAAPISEGPLLLRPTDAGPSSFHPGCRLDPGMVDRTIRRQLPTIQDCYERASREDPTLSGKVTVAFVVRPDGHVRDAEAIENSTGSVAVAACVSRGIRRIRFARGAAGSTGSCVYPFLFGASP